MDNRAVRSQRRLGIDDGRQLFQIPDYPFGGIFGQFYTDAWGIRSPMMDMYRTWSAGRP